MNHYRTLIDSIVYGSGVQLYVLGCHNSYYYHHHRQRQPKQSVVWPTCGSISIWVKSSLTLHHLWCRVPRTCMVQGLSRPGIATYTSVHTLLDLRPVLNWLDKITRDFFFFSPTALPDLSDFRFIFPPFLFSFFNLVPRSLFFTLRTYLSIWFCDVCDFQTWEKFMF